MFVWLGLKEGWVFRIWISDLGNVDEPDDLILIGRHWCSPWIEGYVATWSFSSSSVVDWKQWSGMHLMKGEKGAWCKWMMGKAHLATLIPGPYELTTNDDWGACYDYDTSGCVWRLLLL